MSINGPNNLAQITARVGMARLGTARLGAIGLRWELRDGDPVSDTIEVCTRLNCFGSISGVIGDGEGAAFAYGGSLGWAMACNEDGSGGTDPVQADVNGNFSIPVVACGDWFIIVWSENDEAYLLDVGDTITVVDQTDTPIGTQRFDTLGAHPECPLA